MILEASEVDFREATVDEKKELISKKDYEIIDFLSDASLVNKDKTIMAVVEGVAYPLEEIANKSINSLNSGVEQSG